MRCPFAPQQQYLLIKEGLSQSAVFYEHSTTNETYVKILETASKISCVENLVHFGMHLKCQLSLKLFKNRLPKAAIEYLLFISPPDYTENISQSHFLYLVLFSKLTITALVQRFLILRNFRKVES